MTKSQEWRHPEQADNEVCVGFCTEWEFKNYFEKAYPASRWVGVPYTSDGGIIKNPTDDLKALFMLETVYVASGYKDRLAAVAQRR